MEWKNHKIDEAGQREFSFLDRHNLFKDLMSKEPKPLKKSTNHLNPIYCDTPTPEKPKGEFEVIEEDEYWCESDSKLVKLSLLKLSKSEHDFLEQNWHFHL